MENKYGNYIQNVLKETFNVRSIFTIHYFKYGKNFRVRKEAHNFWEFVYIDSGKAVITADDRQFTLSQGRLIFTSPTRCIPYIPRTNLQIPLSYRSSARPNP